MTLTVGHISYANCAPFFRYLNPAGFAGRIVRGVPAELNRRLAEGTVDVSPSSSFEYARNWRQYLLLPDLSISSRGPVQSVLLFSPRPPQELAEDEIALTGESATSVHLLQILLREFYRLPAVRAAVPARPAEELIAAGRPTLLIGDRALRAALAPPAGMGIYDLGALWHHHTGLPFVFALWIVRRAAIERHPAEVLALQSQLTDSCRLSLSSLERLAAEAPERQWLGAERLVDYWRAMSYDLGEDHLEGLRLFFHFCRKYGFVEEAPEIRFVDK